MLETLVHYGALIAIAYLVIQGIVGLIALCLVGYLLYNTFKDE